MERCEQCISAAEFGHLCCASGVGIAVSLLTLFLLL